MMELSSLLVFAFSLINVTAYESAADFVYPRSVAVDPKGNIYVADSEAHAVFKFSPGSARPTVLLRAEGTPRTPLYNMAGIAANSNGEVAVSDTATSNVYRITAGKP